MPIVASRDTENDSARFAAALRKQFGGAHRGAQRPDDEGGVRRPDDVGPPITPKRPPTGRLNLTI
jgi:hypothetical protein